MNVFLFSKIKLFITKGISLRWTTQPGVTWLSSEMEKSPGMILKYCLSVLCLGCFTTESIYNKITSTWYSSYFFNNISFITGPWLILKMNKVCMYKRMYVCGSVCRVGHDLYMYKLIHVPYTALSVSCSHFVQQIEFKTSRRDA